MYAIETDTIKILGHEYTIERSPMGLIGNPGECNYFYNLIRIANDMPETTQTEVLLHEIIEAICNRCEVEVEHRVITIISEGLHQVLRENKLKFFEDELEQEG